MPPTARELVRHSVEAVLTAVAEGRQFPHGPLVVVAPHGAAWLDDLIHAARATVFDGTGAELGRELEAGMAGDGWPRLKRRLTGAGLAVVRDLEGIGGRPRQELFRHVLDAAGPAGTTWCCAVARHPVATGLEPGLASRLVAGLVVSSGDLPPATLDAPESHGPEEVLAATARHFGFSRRALVGACRGRSLAWARSLAMYLARHLGGASYATIGRTFGGRDHTTALHGVRAASARLAVDAGLADDAARITAALRQRGALGLPAAATAAVGSLSDRRHDTRVNSVHPESTWPAAGT